MHIGMLTACYHPVVNGVTQMIALSEKNLAAAGHQVTIFTLGNPANSEESRRVVRSPGIALGQTGYQVTLAYSAEARRRLKEVDILHCHHPMMALEFARRYGRAPVVFTNHTRYDLYLSSYGHVPDRLARVATAIAWRRWTRNVDVVIAPSASIRQILLDAGVVAPIVVVENGVDVDRIRRDSACSSRAGLGIPEEPIVYTYVGRFSPEKNVHRLIDEFALAAQQDERLFFLGVGGGVLLESVRRRLAEHGLTHRSRLTGHVLPDDVPDLLAMSDVFVSASCTEVHPLTVLEAVAAGLPIVALDSPGIYDIVAGNEVGLLADHSKGSLGQAMIEIAKNVPLRERLAASARRVRPRYDIRNNVERTLALYRQLIERHHDQATRSLVAGLRHRASGDPSSLVRGRSRQFKPLERQRHHGRQ